MPKVFRLTKEGRLIDGIFVGDTINTPSMLCVEDALDGLRWAHDIGGLPELIRRCRANLDATAEWVENSDWVDFLAVRAETRSCTSMCLKIVAPWLTEMPLEGRSGVVKQIVALLESEGVAYDVGSYRDAPPGLRLWGGARWETADLKRCSLSWISFAECGEMIRFWEADGRWWSQYRRGPADLQVDPTDATLPASVPRGWFLPETYRSPNQCSTPWG